MSNFREIRFSRKVGDTGPPYRTVLKVSSEAVDLVGASVTFRMCHIDGVKNIISGAEIVDEAEGVVEYQFNDGDIDTVGLYNVDWFVVLGDGEKITIPQSGFDRGRVDPANGT